MDRRGRAEMARDHRVGSLGTWGVTGDSRDEDVRLEREELHVGQRRHRRRARDVTEQGDLAEVVAATYRYERPAFGLHRELARPDHVEPVAGIASAEDDIAGSQMDAGELRGELLERHLRQRREDGRA